MVDVVVVGAGLSGCVIAERFARQGKRVRILEKREHIGGNCYDFVDAETGVLMNKYGAHIFHTNSQRVWDYVTSFDEWVPYEHKVVANVAGRLVPVPVNATTINTLLDAHLASSDETKEWLAKETIATTRSPTNSEEMAMSRVGPRLFDLLFRDYTIKQWGRPASELAPEVLSRIPVRPSFDPRYFDDRYQALPAKGYTVFFEKLLASCAPLVTVELGSDACLDDVLNTGVPLVVWTGPIDTCFPDLDKLEYRSIKFVSTKLPDTQYYQPAAVVNFPSLATPITRIVEYKHFPTNDMSDCTGTVVVEEHPMQDGEPYYPVPTPHNLDLYEQHRRRAQELLADRVHFVGRLASYKYFNMDAAILNALEYFDQHFLPDHR